MVRIFSRTMLFWCKCNLGPLKIYYQVSMNKTFSQQSLEIRFLQCDVIAPMVLVRRTNNLNQNSPNKHSPQKSFLFEYLSQNCFCVFWEFPRYFWHSLCLSPLRQIHFFLLDFSFEIRRIQKLTTSLTNFNCTLW